MDEEFIHNFWVSSERPENLPNNWFWVKNIFDVNTLLKTYYILYPNSTKIRESMHYISFPSQYFEIINWWYEDLNDDKEAFCIIWRPSICDPVKEDEKYLLGFDINKSLIDDFPFEDLEDEGDYNDEEESEDE